MPSFGCGFAFCRRHLRVLVGASLLDCVQVVGMGHQRIHRIDWNSLAASSQHQDEQKQQNVSHGSISRGAPESHRLDALVAVGPNVPTRAMK